VISLRVRPGSHVVRSVPLAEVAPSARVDDTIRAGIGKAVLIGRARTPEEDLDFSVGMLEEMAVRALSPSTNDPYTALNALDDLSAGLVTLAGRAPAPPCHRDAHGNLRVVAPTVSLADLLDRVLDAMRRYALDHPSVLQRTLELVEQVGDVTRDPALRRRMDVQVEHLLDAFERSGAQDCDVQRLRRHADQARRSLAAPAVRTDVA